MTDADADAPPRAHRPNCAAIPGAAERAYSHCTCPPLKDCRCQEVQALLRRAGHHSALRCAACFAAVVESKNELVRENNELRRLLHVAMDRIGAQSELLSRRAEGDQL